MEMIEDQLSEVRRLVAEKNAKKRLALKTERDNFAIKQRVLSVASGKGGVGKTGFSINVAIALGRLGFKVLLLDADLGLSNVPIAMGEKPEWNLLHVLQGKRQVKEIVYQSRYGIDVVAGGSGFSELADLGTFERNRFIEQLSYLNGYDFLILDTGAGISKNVMAFLLASDEVIVVTTPEPTAMADAYGLIKSIAPEIGEIKTKLVVNRCRTSEDGQSTAKRIMTTSKQFLGLEIELLGYLEDDDLVPRAVLRQTPYLVLDEKSRVSKSILTLAKTISGQQPEAPRAQGNFFMRLLKGI